jgi:predicted RNA binding protein YcfA (HicA-like mRNA interferase family)
MAKLPQLTGAEVIRRLKRLGFLEDHSKGGHAVLRHSVTKAMAVVPCHGSKTVKKGTLHGILKQAGVPIQEFLDA